MSEWKEYKLGDVVQIYDGPHATPKKTIDGKIFLGISNLDKGKINFTNLEYISPSDYSKWTKRVEPQQYDILFSYETKIGEAAIVPKGFECCLGRRMGLLRPILNKVDPKFLLYSYLSPRFQSTLRERTIFGTTVDRIPLKDMAQFPITLPPLPEQQAIASVLSSLDDKIDLLNRQNKTLEAMAETLFRQWFVEESEEGWEEKRLTDVANFINGLPCQRFPVVNEMQKLPVLKIKELSDGITENSDWVTSKVDQNYLIELGDIVFSWSGSLMIKIWNGQNCVLNQHLFKVTSSNYPKWFYYYWCKFHLDSFIQIASSHATTMGHIKRGDLDNSVVIVPPDDFLEIMTQKMKPLLEKQIINFKQIYICKSLRDSLLPKLMNGEIKVLYE